jgi:hypothetical protein
MFETITPWRVVEDPGGVFRGREEEEAMVVGGDSFGLGSLIDCRCWLGEMTRSVPVMTYGNFLGDRERSCV